MGIRLNAHNCQLALREQRAGNGTSTLNSVSSQAVPGLLRCKEARQGVPFVSGTRGYIIPSKTDDVPRASAPPHLINLNTVSLPNHCHVTFPQQRVLIPKRE